MLRAGRDRFEVDAALALRSDSAAAADASGANTPVNLDLLASYWDANERAEKHQFHVTGAVEAVTGDGDIVVETDAASGFGTPTTLVTFSGVTAGQALHASFSREQLKAADPTAQFIRARHALDGGTADGTITFADNADEDDAITITDNAGNDETYVFGSDPGEVDPGADADASAANLADEINNTPGTLVGVSAVAVGPVVTVSFTGTFADAAIVEDVDGSTNFTVLTPEAGSASVTYNLRLAPFTGA